MLDGDGKLIEGSKELLDAGSRLFGSTFVILDWYSVIGRDAVHIAPSEGGEHAAESNIESRETAPSIV